MIYLYLLFFVPCSNEGSKTEINSFKEICRAFHSSINFELFRSNNVLLENINEMLNLLFKITCAVHNEFD